MTPKRVLSRQGLGGKDVQHRMRQAAGVQGRQQVSLDHVAPSSEVHKGRARLHLGQETGVDDAPGVGCQRQQVEHDVGCGQALLQAFGAAQDRHARGALDLGDLGGGGISRSPTPDRHPVALSGQGCGHRRAHGAQTQYQHPYIRCALLRQLVPVPGALLLRVKEEASVQGRHRPQRRLHHGRRHRGVHHPRQGQALGHGAVGQETVHPCPKRLDQPQPLHLGECPSRWVRHHRHIGLHGLRLGNVGARGGQPLVAGRGRLQGFLPGLGLRGVDVRCKEDAHGFRHLVAAGGAVSPAQRSS